MHNPTQLTRFYMTTAMRAMLGEDLGSVANLCQQLGYPTTPAELSQRFDELSQSLHHAFFVYQDQAQLLGFMHLEKINSFLGHPKIEIRALVIDKNFRGKGLGKLFIEESKRWAKSNGIHTLFLSCNIMREDAHKFYERRGFKKIKTSHIFETSL